MQNDLHSILETIIKLVQTKDYETADKLCLSLNANEMLVLIKEKNTLELNILLEKTQSAIGLLDIERALILDELTLLQKSKKALQNY